MACTQKTNYCKRFRIAKEDVRYCDADGHVHVRQTDNGEYRWELCEDAMGRAA